jgi:hypothetical protein
MKGSASRKLVAILAFAFLIAPLAAYGESAAQQKTPAAAASSKAGTPCPNPPPCGANCSNHPFAPTECWTTPYGPAKADVIVGVALKSTNMLYCNGGTYALCFFSGPPKKTGTNPANKPLPCVLEGNVAKCTCQAYNSGAYYVDINSILNRGAYFQTVSACGQDGSKCANITNQNLPPAPVCQYVKNQNPNDANASLMPKADLISTFSFAMNTDYKIGSTSCPSGRYAGCMTAPCFYIKVAKKSQVKDGDSVRCDCPIYDGAYQVGQSNQACTIPGEGKASFIWSASNTVPAAGNKK